MFREALLNGAWEQHGLFGFTGDVDQTGHPHEPGLDELLLNVNAPSLGGRLLEVTLLSISASDIFAGEPYDIRARARNFEATGIGITLEAMVTSSSDPGIWQTLTPQAFGIEGEAKESGVFVDMSTLSQGTYIVTVKIKETGEQGAALFTIR